MKKLFFTIAVCLLTTLSFATNEKASENVEVIEMHYYYIEVPCGDGFIWDYSGYMDDASVDAMIAQLRSGC